MCTVGTCTNKTPYIKQKTWGASFIFEGISQFHPLLPALIYCCKVCQVLLVFGARQL